MSMIGDQVLRNRKAFYKEHGYKAFTSELTRPFPGNSLKTEVTYGGALRHNYLGNIQYRFAQISATIFHWISTICTCGKL